jgi:hypothetical protein
LILIAVRVLLFSLLLAIAAATKHPNPKGHRDTAVHL